MALPIRHNIETFVDTFVRREFRWYVDKEPVDLTDWTGVLRIGRDGAYLMDVDDAVTLGADGTVSVDMPAGTLPEVGTYSYVIDLFDPNAGTGWLQGQIPLRFAMGTLHAAVVFP